jgi:hypothetical protein
MKVLLLCLFLFLFVSSASAQMTMPGMSAMENSVGFISSGTSLQPKVTSESSPMVHTSIGNSALMFHGNVFVLDTQQTGPRGFDKFFSINWFMPMIARDFGRQTLSFRTMFSIEPATVTHRRYPELFQTGETAFGLPIVDGQHPHDAFMEIAGRYDLKVGEGSSRLYVYGGPLGEPALGPTAYPHRASASENPVAVLGHHQEDSTHVSNNVITTGFSSGPVQLEASTFHGREPNENRWNFDGGVPDSFSSRITLAANANLLGQFSIGRINDREALETNLDTVRTTASISHGLQFSKGHLASSLIWGRNKDLHNGERRIFNSYTAESTFQWNRNWVWTRIENVDRDRTLLVGETRAAFTVEEDPIGRVQAYTFGYERDFPIGISSINAGVGFQATAYGVPPQLKSVYGNRPAGFTIFLHLRPSTRFAQHMRLMHQH